MITIKAMQPILRNKLLDIAGVGWLIAALMIGVIFLGIETKQIEFV